MKKSIVLICIWIIISISFLNPVFIETNYSASNTQNSINEQLSTISRGSRGIQLSADKLEDIIEPGQHKVNQIKLVNNGADSTFIFKVDSSSTNWAIKLDDDEVIINSMYEHVTDLHITAPWDNQLSDQVTIKIIVTDKNNQEITNKISIEYTLNINIDFEIEILKEIVQDPQDPLYGKKGIHLNKNDMATIELRIKNNGNINDSYDLKISGLPWDWYAEFIDSNSSIFNNASRLDAQIMAYQFSKVYKGSQNIVKFVIYTPDFVLKDETVELWIVAESNYSKSSDNIKDKGKSDSLIIQGNNSLKLELKCENPRKYVKNGSDVIYEIEVYNYLESDITVEFTYSDIDSGWDIQFYNENNFKIPEYDLKINVRSKSSVTIMISIGAPSYLLAGNKMITIIRGISQSGNNIISKDVIGLTTIIHQNFKLNINFPTLEIQAEPGSTISYNFSIENLGNGDDFVLILNAAENELWCKFFFNGIEGVNSNLLLNETISVQLQILIPTNQSAGNYSIIINISSIGYREFIELKCEVIERLDLELVNVNKTINFTSDEEKRVLIINASVKNNGNKVMKEILVGLYDNGNDVSKNMINVIQQNHTRWTIFTWEISYGKHNLTIKIDPANEISEIYEVNNEWSTEFNYSDNDDKNNSITSKKEENFSFIIIGTILIILIIILITFFLIKNKKIKQQSNTPPSIPSTISTQQSPTFQKDSNCYSQQQNQNRQSNNFRPQEYNCINCNEKIDNPQNCPYCGWIKQF
jgi:uncharacterized membrane protein